MTFKNKIAIIVVAILLLAFTLTGYIYKNSVSTANLTDSANITEGISVLSGSKVEVEEIYLSEKNVSLYVGDTFILASSIYPSNASDKIVLWTSDKNAVVSVDNGKIIAKAIGTAKITASASNGDTAVCNVEVLEKVLAPLYISLNEKLVTLNVGKTATLVATITPSNATDKTVTWKSSDDTVVSVDNGKITAISAGNAEITVFTANELMTTCMVIVEKAKG